MTVMMYRSQQHGQRGQRIDTRKPESGIVLTWIGKIKLAAFPLGKRLRWFALAFSPCGVQGKLKFLLSFDRVNKYTAKYLLIMDGQIKSKRLCRSTFCERDMLSNCVKHKPDTWWLVIFFYFQK